MTLLSVKFGANLVNICKVTDCRTRWPRFFGRYPVDEARHEWIDDEDARLTSALAKRRLG